MSFWCMAGSSCANMYKQNYNYLAYDGTKFVLYLDETLEYEYLGIVQ